MIQGQKQNNNNNKNPEIKTSEENIIESEGQNNKGLYSASLEKSSNSTKSTHAEYPKEDEFVAPEVREDTDIVNNIKTVKKQSEQWAEAERDVELWQSQNGIKLR